MENRLQYWVRKTRKMIFNVVIIYSMHKKVNLDKILPCNTLSHNKFPKKCNDLETRQYFMNNFNPRLSYINSLKYFQSVYA